MGSGGVAEYIGPEVVARNGAAGDGLDGKATFCRHPLTVFPSRDGWRPDAEGGGQSVLAAENFDCAVDRFVFHDCI